MTTPANPAMPGSATTLAAIEKRPVAMSASSVPKSYVIVSSVVPESR
jgi:hypothetical protein